jgi:cardiolipin synthase
MSRRTLSSLIGIVVFVLLAIAQTYSGSGASQKNISARPSSVASVPYVIVPEQSVSLYTEPEAGISPILSRIKTASTSIDLVIYELTDQQVEDSLAAAHSRGVAVRVLLNGGLYGNGSKKNQNAYDYLHSKGVPVEWSPSYFALTHQKTLIIDNKEALIMTFNMTPKYYPTGRDFIVVDPDPSDVAAIEKAFTNDWSGIQDKATNGDDLVWSPGSKGILLAMINASKTSLRIYNEELQDQDVVDALAAAAGRGVSVELLMTDSKQWHAGYAKIIAAGGEVHTFAPTAPLYIHAKMIIADGTQAFVGSENFSTNSMQNNRELGLFISTPGAITSLVSTFATDWGKAESY